MKCNRISWDMNFNFQEMSFLMKYRKLVGNLHAKLLKIHIVIQLPILIDWFMVLWKFQDNFIWIIILKDLIIGLHLQICCLLRSETWWDVNVPQKRRKSSKSTKKSNESAKKIHKSWRLFASKTDFEVEQMTFW